MSLRRSRHMRKTKNAIARKKAIRRRIDSATSVASSWSTTTTSAISPMIRKPRREDGGERERPVRVVQLVRVAPVVGEEEQAEPDLRHEHDLREREQVREE